MFFLSSPRLASTQLAKIICAVFLLFCHPSLQALFYAEFSEELPLELYDLDFLHKDLQAIVENAKEEGMTEDPSEQPIDVFQYDEAVSLGINCQVAGNLKERKIRKNAYPFDWNVTYFPSLINFIIGRGKHFLDRDKLALLKSIEGIPTFTVLDLQYKMIIAHDFKKPDFLSDYEEVKEKYRRRVERFFNLLESNKRVLFVRLHITRQQAEYLDYILHTHYPNLSYTLLVLSQSEEFKEDWGLERVKNFYIKEKGMTWQGDGVRWRQILKQFLVTPATEPLGLNQ